MKATLQETLLKTPAVRLSTWSRGALNDAQIKYAALDVIKALEVYFKLSPMPNLTARLVKADIVPGKLIDIVPSHGSVEVLATRAASAVILPQPVPLQWQMPAVFKASKSAPKGPLCLVSVTQVLAPSLRVPGMMHGDKPVTLGDCQVGQRPFTLLLPLAMLKVHVPLPSVRVTFAENVAPSSGGSASAPNVVTSSGALGSQSAQNGASCGAPVSVHVPALQSSASQSRKTRSAHLRALAAAQQDDKDEDEVGFTSGSAQDGDADLDEVTQHDVEMLRAAAAAANLPSLIDFDKWLDTGGLVRVCV